MSSAPTSPTSPTTFTYSKGLSLRLVDLGRGEYVHDTASERYPLYTRGNVGEVFPEVVYPLSSSLARTTGEEPFTALYIATGGMTVEDFDEDLTIGAPVATFAGYNYLNLTVARTLTGRAPGSKPEDIDRVFFGRDGLAPPHPKKKTDRSLKASLALMRFAFETTRIRELPQLDEDKIELAAWRDGLTPVAEASDDELVARIVDAIERVSVLFKRHLLVSQQAATAHVVLSDLCDRFVDGGVDAVSLLGGIGDVESAEPARRLWALSRLEPDAPTYDEEFNAFLVDQGSRGPNEWDAASPSWGTDPSMVTAMIASLRAADASQSPAARDQRLADEHTATLRQLPTNRLVRPLIDRVLESAIVLSQGRERAKTTVVKVVHEVRLAGNELGRRLAERAGSDQADDVWFVYWHEFDDYRADPASFADRIAERRATRTALMELEPPFIFDGELPPLDTWQRRDDTTSAAAVEPGTILEGTSGCAGTVTGVARIVRDASDDVDLGPGTILIAPLTDPSWTPLFMGVDAVVVNVGGQMSHAVIVARELGIPCVVSVDRATDVIPDGATITVNGSAGTVTID